MSDKERAEALMVVRANADAMKRGVLAIWTIYNRPTDYPDGFIARCHESGKDGSVATDKTVAGDLNEIRYVFYRAGLHRLARHLEDEPQIVECWL